MYNIKTNQPLSGMLFGNITLFQVARDYLCPKGSVILPRNTPTDVVLLKYRAIWSVQFYVMPQDLYYLMPGHMVCIVLCHAIWSGLYYVLQYGQYSFISYHMVCITLCQAIWSVLSYGMPYGMHCIMSCNMVCIALYHAISYYHLYYIMSVQRLVLEYSILWIYFTANSSVMVITWQSNVCHFRAPLLIVIQVCIIRKWPQYLQS